VESAPIIHRGGETKRHPAGPPRALPAALLGQRLGEPFGDAVLDAAGGDLIALARRRPEFP
jgi:hypothetical protein